MKTMYDMLTEVQQMPTKTKVSIRWEQSYYETTGMWYVNMQLDSDAGRVEVDASHKTDVLEALTECYDKFMKLCRVGLPPNTYNNQLTYQPVKSEYHAEYPEPTDTPVNAS